LYVSSEPAGSEDTYKFFGQYYPRSQAVTDFAPVYQVLKQNIQDAGYPTTYNIQNAAGRALDNLSVYDWIEQNVAGGHGSPMGQFLDAAYTEELATDTRLQSSLNLIYLIGFQMGNGNAASFEIFGSSDERFHTIGGNDQIPLAIANYLGGAGGAHIKTGYALTKIKRESDGRFTTTYAVAGGTATRTTDYVVLCLPFSCLRDLDYSQAGFDPLKNTTIQTLGMGRSGKLQLQYNSRLWNTTGPWPNISNGNIYTDLGFQNTWDVTRGQPGNQGILVFYTGGPVSLALNAAGPYLFAGGKGVSKDIGTFLPELEKVYPGATAAWNGKAASSVPHLDPFLKLSYSNWRLGQYQTIAGYEIVRQGNCFFAGEHCSVDFQGFMEGGALTGTQVATNLVKDIIQS
jgi:monoamine oxidase